MNRHPRFSSDASKIKVIANKVDSEEEGHSLFEKVDSVVSRYLKLPITYLGAIPRDTQLAKAVMQQMQVSMQAPHAKSAIAFENMAATLMNKELNKDVKKRGMAAFFSHIVTGKKINL